MIKYILLLGIGMLISLSSCKKCKECYLVEAEGTPSEVTSSLGEKCGDELDEIDGESYTAIDGPARSYCN